MTVGELKDRLSALPDDMLVLVGHTCTLEVFEPWVEVEARELPTGELIFLLIAPDGDAL